MAPDHPGTTLGDLLRARTSTRSALVLDAAAALLEEATRTRPADVAAVVAAADRLEGLAVTPERLVMAGHSLGGWTAIVATARERRVRAALLLAPAGGPSARDDDPLRRALDVNWGREVPTLVLAAAGDSVLSLDGIMDVAARLPVREKRLVVLGGVDHFHFCDRAERLHELMRRMNPRLRASDTLIPAARTEPVIRALVAAHCEAYLDDVAAAQRWLTGGVLAAGARYDVPIDIR
jgi:dienelactone hydrolase